MKLPTVERITKVIRKLRWEFMAGAARGDYKLREVVFRRSEGGFADEVYCNRSPSCIEPGLGYIITRNGLLIRESIGIPATASWKFGLPDPSKFYSHVRSRQPTTIYYSKVVSLRHAWEWNYFHFYSDVLSKLALLDASGINPSVPLVLGNYADDVPFVKQVIKLGRLAERNWILPGHNFVHADEIYYCQLNSMRKNGFEHTVALMDLPAPDPDSIDRVFLTRPETATRRIVNMDEIEPILHKHQFRIVETSAMTVEKQAHLFANTRYLIGIHGAGLTNIIFRNGAPLSLLELRSDTYCAECFQEICADYGYRASILVGKSDGGNPQHANFSVNPRELDASIAEMLNC